MDSLSDIFPPPAPAGLEGAGVLPWWPFALLVVAGLVLALLWRRRLALRWWWLQQRVRRGRLAPREAARRALQLLRGRAGIPPRAAHAAWEASLRELEARCYGRATPRAAEVDAVLTRVRTWL